MSLVKYGCICISGHSWLCVVRWSGVKYIYNLYVYYIYIYICIYSFEQFLTLTIFIVHYSSFIVMISNTSLITPNNWTIYFNYIYLLWFSYLFRCSLHLHQGELRALYLKPHAVTQILAVVTAGFK